MKTGNTMMKNSSITKKRSLFQNRSKITSTMKKNRIKTRKDLIMINIQKNLNTIGDLINIRGSRMIITMKKKKPEESKAHSKIHFPMIIMVMIIGLKRTQRRKSEKIIIKKKTSTIMKNMMREINNTILKKATPKSKISKKTKNRSNIKTKKKAEEKKKRSFLIFWKNHWLKRD